MFSGLRTRAPELALFALAAVISGFTLLRQIDPFDEGLVLQAARRIAEGQVPYRDFFWVYGPGQPYLLAGTAELFGDSLVHWRVLRTAVDASVALTAFVIVRREAGTRWGLAAFAGVALLMAQPTGANPLSVSLMLSLLAIAVASHPGAGARRAPLAAGALCALAAVWRLDFAVFGGAAALAALVAWRSPRPVRLRAAGLFAAAGAGVALLLYLPMAIAAGPGTVLDSLLGASARGRQGLPFPFAYDGLFRLSSPATLAEDAKDLLGFYVPLLCVAGLGCAALGVAIGRDGARRPSPAVAGLGVLAVGALVYMLSRTDEFHSQPLAVVVVTLLAVLAGTRRLGRPLAVGAVAIIALLTAHGISNRASALLKPPELATIDVEAADGVKAPPATARSLERTVAVVQRLVPPGEPTYVATRRSDIVRITNPLLFVLLDRDSVYRMDLGPVSGGREQREIVAALRRARPPALVRWTDPTSTRYEPNPSSKSSGSRALDDYLARAYRLSERNGYYEVLVPRDRP